jgi:PAS domain S-box-containing protein
MWICDLKTLRFLEVNNAAIRHYGYSREEFLRMLLTDIQPSESVPDRPEEAGQGGEWRHLLRNGRLIDVESASHNLLFGGYKAQLIVLRDITKQRHAERALQQTERKYRLIFEEAIIGIYESTPDGRLLSANAAMARMFGYDSAEEMVARITDIQPQLYVDPARREEFKRLMRERGVVRHFEVQVYRKDGSKMWLSTNARTHSGGDSIVRYEGTFEDITGRKQLENQLHEAQQDYRDIVQNAVIGIFQSSPDGRYLSVNPAMATMMGYDSPDELIETVTDIARQVYVDPQRREELQTLAKEQGVVKNFECQLYRKDGSKMWIPRMLGPFPRMAS